MDDKHISFAVEFAAEGYDNAVDAAMDAAMAETGGTDGASFSMAMASLEDAFQFLLSTLGDAREYARQQTTLQLEEMDRVRADIIGAERPPVIKDVVHLSDDELFEKLRGYQKYILDHQNRKI